MQLGHFLHTVLSYSMVPAIPITTCTPIAEATWARCGVFYVPSPSPLNQRRGSGECASVETVHRQACIVPEIAYVDPWQQLFSMGLQRHTPVLVALLVDEVGLSAADLGRLAWH